MQNAVHFPLSRRPASESEPNVWQNRLLDLYAVVAPNPFFGTTDTQPIFRARLVAEQSPPNLLETTLAQPFATVEFAMPRVVARIIGFDSPNLLESTLSIPFFGSVLDVPQVKRVTQSTDWIQNLLGTTLVVTVATPFSQLDWPLPIQRPRSSIVEIPQNLLVTTLVVAAGSPFFQSDWPNPIQAEYPVDLRSWVFALLPMGLVAEAVISGTRLELQGSSGYRFSIIGSSGNREEIQGSSGNRSKLQGL